MVLLAHKIVKLIVPWVTALSHLLHERWLDKEQDAQLDESTRRGPPSYDKGPMNDYLEQSFFAFGRDF